MHKNAKTSAYKSGERKEIGEAGCHLILNIGDRLSDLDGNPQAERSVKLPNRFITSRSSLCSRLLWNRFAVGPGIGAGEVHIALGFSHDCLALSHRERKWLEQFNLMPALG